MLVGFVIYVVIFGVIGYELVGMLHVRGCVELVEIWLV